MDMSVDQNEGESDIPKRGTGKTKTLDETDEVNQVEDQGADHAEEQEGMVDR